MEIESPLPPKSWLFVHGFWGSAFNWKSVVEKAGLKDVAVVPDLLGHGRNIPPEGTALNLENLSSDLLCQIPGQKTGNISGNISGPLSIHYAVVHSFGLRPLLKIREHLKNLKALIVEDTCPEMTKSSFDEIKAILEACPDTFSSRPAAKEFLLKTFAHDPRLANFLYMSVVETRSGAAFRMPLRELKSLLLEAFTHPQWAEWSELRCTIDMVLGENSQSVPVDLVTKAQALRPNPPIRLIKIAQSGHWVHAEQMGKFVQVILDMQSGLIKDQT